MSHVPDHPPRSRARRLRDGILRTVPYPPHPLDHALHIGALERWRLYVPSLPAANDRAKRALDVVLGVVLLALSAPLLLAAMAAIKVTSGGPVLFTQSRIGYRCRIFRMHKLRTMRNGAEREKPHAEAPDVDRLFFKLEKDPRTTRLGRWLRKFSIDELPQLVDVIRGDMSLVGPRPLLLSDYAKFPKSKQLRRFAVKPGITGLWQVSGRSRLDDRRRIELDLLYVDRWSLRLDLQILARTVPAVLRGEGAY
ncbi:MAG: sugar transferase [Gemmatimonadota bacterium]|nr:sugar transferase [Gemmatimonadota bacterium]